MRVPLGACAAACLALTLLPCRPAQTARTAGGTVAGANHYDWVTAPGSGLKSGEVAGVLHEYDLRVIPNGTRGLSARVADETYLLLAEGTVHDGLPVAPDSLDVALSREKEPAAWGRWRREGGRITASWRGGTWAALRGRMALPAMPGQRPAGHWGAGAASTGLSSGADGLRGVTFTAAGHFAEDRNGGPDADRAGTYSLSGYALTLRYDDGRTERAPFFFADADRDELFFEGRTLGRDDEK